MLIFFNIQHIPSTHVHTQCQKATEIPSVLLAPHPDIARLLAALPPSIDPERVDLEEALGPRLGDDAWLNALQALVGGWESEVSAGVGGD